MAFHLSPDDRRRHLYVIGRTGTGKSTFIENYLDYSRGFLLIDPHGTTARKAADQVPRSRTSAVIYLNPSDLSFSVGLNVLERVPEDQRPLVASNIVSSFKAIWGETSWGPRMEYILYNALRLLLDHGDTTLLGLPRLLSDKRYRTRLYRTCRDPVVLSFWKTEFEKWEEKFRREAVAPVQNKVGQLLATPALRHILCQKRSTIDPSRIMERGDILIVNLSRIGREPASLLGALLVNAFASAAEQREADAPDFDLVIDEVGSVATDTFATILSEMRKRNVSLLLANQYLAQLPRGLREAIFGNVGTLISFRVGAEDAELLGKELDFNPRDLADLPNFKARVKALRDGSPTEATLVTTDPPRASQGRLRAIQRETQGNHARARSLVEQEILDSLGR